MQASNFSFILLAAAACAAQGQPFYLLPAANTSVSYLGVGLQDINADRAKALKLPEEAGVEITLVVPNSPAAAAGIKAGDVVTRYDDQRVEGRDQFQRMVHETPPGREVKLQVYRDGMPQTVTARIGSQSAPLVQGRLLPGSPGALAPVSPLPNFPDVPFSRMSWGTGLGAEVESVSGQLAEYFGVKQGVLVRSVTRGSAAEKGGLKAGDVITRLGDASIAAPADLLARLRAGRGQSAALTVMRDHKELNLTVEFDTPRAAEPF